MGLTLYQINNGIVPPVADARLYELLSSGAAGIVQGVEVTSLDIKVKRGCDTILQV